MTPKEFFDTVARMRKHQKDFDRSRGRDTLSQRYAKELEARIDHEIKRVQLLEKERLQNRLDL